MRSLSAACLLVLLLLGAAPARWVGFADASFTNLTQENGIPNPVVSALAQDRDGFVWLGTQSGLARWDGYRFHTYNADPNDPHALYDGYVLSLYADRGGTVWAGTAHGGVARYDRATGTFTTFDSHDQVRSIGADASGKLLLGTENGLKQLDTVSGRVTFVPGLAHQSISGITSDAAGALWVGTASGPLRRLPGHRVFERIPLPGAGSVRIFALFADAEGNVWIGTRGAGAFEFVAKSQTVRAIVEAAAPAALSGDLVLAFAQPSPDKIWIGTYSQGIVVFDETNGATRRIRNDPILPRSLVNDAIWSLLVDRSGLMWIGTGEGVSVGDPAPAAIMTMRGAKGRWNGISDSDVTAVGVASDGTIWAGLSTNGVAVVDPQRGVIASIRPDPAHPETGLPLDRVFAMARAPGGGMFLGTPEGLYRADRLGLNVERVSIPGRDVTASAEVLQNIGGDLWIGSWTDGIWRIDASNGPRVLFHLSGSALSDTNINSIEPAPGGALWIGTSKGLNRLVPRNGSIERIMPRPEDPHALGAGPITWLATDLRGRLWVPTLGGGISVLARRDASGRARFERIGTANGLPNANADMVLRDRSGFMWVSTDAGIARIDPNTFAVRPFGKDDGLQVGAYWGGAGAATPRGELLFGGAGGLTIVLPHNVRRWHYVAPVAVTDVRVGGRSQPANGKIDVPGGRNSVTVEFSALDYSAPASNQYQYKLEGFDRDWITTDASRRTASYTNLPPGNYTLRLRGSNRAGTYSPEVGVPIHVNAAWYQTIWFVLIELLAAVVALYALHRGRTALLRRRARELERLVQVRTEELERTAHELELKSEELERASLTDPLTGLRNRRFLALSMESEGPMAVRSYEDAGGRPAGCDSSLVLFIADIDHFKAVNDEYGHAAGDAVLAQMRMRLESVFRESDYVVRWGGEEFLIVSRGSFPEAGAELAERLRRAVAQAPFDLGDGRALEKTCSVGFAAFPFVAAAPRAFSWEEVAALADAGLYAAKNAGRNGWVGLFAADEAEEVVAAVKRSVADAVRARALHFETNLDADAVRKAFEASILPQKAAS